MPFTVKDAHKKKKGMTAKQARQWVEVANSVLAACIKKGGTDKTCSPKAILRASGVVKKSMEQSMDDEMKKLPNSDFLVLAEGDRHLPVRIQGEPNRKLANMAWAHLFADNQADEYKGPGKAAAKSAIRALYRETGWETPQNEEGVFYDPEGVIAEYHDHDAYPSDNDGKARRVPWGVVTFEDLDKAQELAALGDRLDIRVDQFQTMFWRIWGNVSYFGDGPTPAEARTAWTALFKEFIAVFETEADIAADQATGESQMGEVDFSESAVMSNAVIGEAGETLPERSHLSMNIEIIQPGFGNKKDNHYYPASVLRRDAHVFEGLKMYTTNHREDQRSERTEVSQIESIVGFSEVGAPIARVIVFDPDFAEKTRNRAAAGKLGSLECSILATGRATSGQINGVDANIVETITAGKAVDWVTSGGAGGRATSLNESQLTETGEPIMSEKETEPTQEQEQEKETPVEEQETTETTLSEQEQKAALADVFVATLAESRIKSYEKQQSKQETEEDIPLSEAEVSSQLNECNLPSPSKVRLAQVSYLSEDALTEAIQQETEYVKMLTGSGKPKASGTTRGAAAAPTKTLEEINAAKDAVNEKWINTRPPQPQKDKT